MDNVMKDNGEHTTIINNVKYHMVANEDHGIWLIINNAEEQ